LHLKILSLYFQTSKTQISDKIKGAADKAKGKLKGAAAKGKEAAGKAKGNHILTYLIQFIFQEKRKKSPVKPNRKERQKKHWTS
jgi:hypothetical protein